VTYDLIGAGYDATRRADPSIAARLAFHLRCAPGECCLDLACGTGNYTTMLARSGLVAVTMRYGKAGRPEHRYRWADAVAAGGS